MERGEFEHAPQGTPKGGVRLLLAILCLHYALDVWVQEWRERSRGKVIIVREADDFVVGIQRHEEAKRFIRKL